MLSNLKLDVIKSKLSYLKLCLRNEGKYLDPQGMKVLNIQLSKVKAQLKEAQARNIVGRAGEEQLAVYTADSVIDDVDTILVYIEGLPTGWNASDLDMTSGQTSQLLVDASTGWSEIVLWN
tara:strand:- start:2046 stop:2408 length:363 start_codon:yes stop_codon:yes gene_type:complete